MDLKAGVPQSVVSKAGFLAKDEKTIDKRLEHARFSKLFLTYSLEIAKYLATLSNSEIVCVTGSSVYLDVIPGHDVDIMLISSRKNLFKELFRCFLIARKLKLNKIKTNICINVACSIEDFNEEIGNRCSALIALDLIKAAPIKNQELYYSLLKRNDCIKKYFRKYYDNKLINYNQKIKKSSHSFSNIFFLLMLFIYFKIVNKIRYLKLLKEKRFINLFEYELSPSLFMIKSSKYEILKKRFERIF